MNFYNLWKVLLHNIASFFFFVVAISCFSHYSLCWGSFFSSLLFIILIVYCLFLSFVIFFSLQSPNVVFFFSFCGFTVIVIFACSNVAILRVYDGLDTLLYLNCWFTNNWSWSFVLALTLVLTKHIAFIFILLIFWKYYWPNILFYLI